jgi:hypothetical protein
MKIIRMDDDHYVLNVESTTLTSERAHQLQEAWADWIKTGGTPEKLLILGGEPVTYLDVRYHNPETRMQAVEEKLDRLLDMLS